MPAFFFIFLQHFNRLKECKQESQLGRPDTYDISANPYNFRLIDEQQLNHEYYERLYQHLERRGIFLKRKPA